MADNNVGVRAGGVIVSSAPGLPTGYADELQGGVHQVGAGGRNTISTARRTNGLIAIEPGGAWILDDGTWRSFLQWQHQNVPDLSQLQDTPDGIIVTLANGELRRISLNHFRELVGGLDPNTGGGFVHTNEVAIITEVTMVAPNIVAITVRDPPYTFNPIRQVSPLDPSISLRDNVEIGGQWGLIHGENRDWFRPYDTPPSERLDRVLLENANGYGGFGSLYVTESCYKAYPYDSVGIHFKEDLNNAYYSSYEYQIYLILSGPLPQGTYTITWPQEMLPPTAFTFNDKVTRCSAIHTNHIGHRPQDRSKWACISQWIPRRYYGNTRYIASYGLEEFHIIDGNGDIVATYPVTLFQDGAHSVDFGLGPGTDYAGQESYAQIGNGPIRITEGVSVNSFIAPGCNWELGSRVVFKGMLAFDDVSFGSGTIQSILNRGQPNALVILDPATLQYPKNFDESNRYWPLGILNAEAKMYRALQGSVSFCDVAELDFSAFTPANNTTYRLYIPGYGVSDPIHFNTNRWDYLTQEVCRATYYQRSGCALEDLWGWGYSRPAAFVPDSRNKIRTTVAPTQLYWDGAGGIGIEEKEPNLNPYFTDFTVPSTWIGGHMDAGDWDVNALHIPESYLGRVFEYIICKKNGATPKHYGLPKSSAVLGSAYAGTDNMCDTLHELAYGLHFYRVSQAANGGIRGGLNIVNPEYELSKTTSWLWPGLASIPAPDHRSSYNYAQVAAIFSRILREEGYTSLADTYLTSATAAWNFAEACVADPDTAYADFISVATAQGVFVNRSWEDIRDNILLYGWGPDTIRDIRVRTASGLYYATDGAISQYREIVENPGPGFNFVENNSNSLIVFFQGEVTGHNVEQVAARRGEVYEYTLQLEPVRLNYPVMKDRRVPSVWGGLLGLPMCYMIWSSILSYEWFRDDPERPMAATIPKRMQDCLSHYLGANQIGKSLLHRRGFRWATEPTHDDALIQGEKVFPAVPIYGWINRNNAMLSQNWLFGYEWSAMPQFGPNSDEAAKRAIYPPLTHTPMWESLYIYPYIIPQQEYTLNQRFMLFVSITRYLDCLPT